MKTAITWTYFTLVIVALAGLWMRAMPLFPGQVVEFDFLRHAHSHLAFLGWVYGAFYLAFVYFFLPAGSFGNSRYRQLFWLTQAVSAGMFTAFLMQGYGAGSIAFLTIHTGLAYYFFYCFIKDWKKGWRQPSTWFGLAAIGAFFLSSLGPFAIPVIQVVEGGNMHLMRMAIHFYLHFHYNGWFVFGLLAIFFKILEKSGIACHSGFWRWQWWLMVPALLPAYFLFAPSNEAGDSTNFLWLATGWVQWAGMALFAFHFIKMEWGRKLGGPSVEVFLLRIAIVLLLLKYSFELLAIQPALSHIIVRGDHFLTLGYLHLLFLGSVTPFIWWFSARAGWAAVQRRSVVLGIVLFLVGFAGSETGLFAMGLRWLVPAFTQMMLLFSGLMAMGILLYFGGIANNSARG